MIHLNALRFFIMSKACTHSAHVCTPETLFPEDDTGDLSFGMSMGGGAVPVCEGATGVGAGSGAGAGLGALPPRSENLKDAAAGFASTFLSNLQLRPLGSQLSGISGGGCGRPANGLGTSGSDSTGNCGALSGCS